MIETIYLEAAASDHPRSQAILERFNRARVIECAHYGEVFNRNNQNFRLQKQQPALILAKKAGRRLLPVPSGYGLDGASGHYFSHMLNCLYDCRYCFLQGMFRSAHYLLFVNYEDFIDDIRVHCRENSTPQWFFSGYDCDSLALEPLTDFAATFIPALATIDNAWLELRTKSTQIRSLLAMPAQARTVCAFSLNPQTVVEQLEARTPSLDSRLAAIQRLQRHGWPVALRFDPLISVDDFQATYAEFFEHVFSRLDAASLHSVTYGGFRLPAKHFNRIQQLYPEEKLFASVDKQNHALVGYAPDHERLMLDWCETQLGHRLDNVPLYRQTV